MNREELDQLYQKNKDNREVIFKEVMPKFPEECPITGCTKSTFCYYPTVGIVYLTEPAYTGYTLAEYSPEDREFIAHKIDLDEGVHEGVVGVANLHQILEWKRLPYIIEFFNIPKEHIEEATIERDEMYGYNS